MVITLAIAPKRSTKNITANIHRALRPLGARHLHDDNDLASAFDLVHLMVEQHVRAHALRIVRRVPDVRNHLFHVGHADNSPLAVTLGNA